MFEYCLSSIFGFIFTTSFIYFSLFLYNINNIFLKSLSSCTSTIIAWKGIKRCNWKLCAIMRESRNDIKILLIHLKDNFSYGRMTQMSDIKGKDLAKQITLLDSWFYEKLDATELITAACTGSLTTKVS